MNRNNVYRTIAKEIIQKKPLSTFRGYRSSIAVVKEIIEMYENVRSEDIVRQGLFKSKEVKTRV